MRLRRVLLAAALSAAISPSTTGSAHAANVVSRSDIPAGTIVVKTGARRLYYGLGGGKALEYSVGVGRSGKQWSGNRMILSKHIKPAWTPPAQIRRDKPGLPAVIPGGSPKNPMGHAALLLSGDGQFAIHGTNAPGSIGGFVSYGCIRMHNADVMDLYGRVGIGTPVRVVH